MNRFENEAYERWGNADAYREHEQKTKSYTKEKWAEASEGLEKIFDEFAVLKRKASLPHSDEALSLVKKLQSHITAYYYTCTDDILKGLGEMYITDERFEKNIDKHGEGTAVFVSKAIESYCAKRGQL